MSQNTLTAQEKKLLLTIARDTLESYARDRARPALPSALPQALGQAAGAFVTLHHHGQLRGCIGTFHGHGPLAETIAGMAVAAGWEDPRFPPLTAREIPGLDLEISVLSPLRKIQDVSEIQVGRDGIYITKGRRSGVLLPQVAVEQGWDRDEFLSHTCQKAGLPAHAWEKGGLTIEVFTAQVFGENDEA